MKTSSPRAAAFTLVEIMIVVAIIGLLAAIAVSNYTKARELSQKTVCLQNLTQITRAKIQWAMENQAGSGDTPDDTDIYGPDKYLKKKPVCPQNGDYILGPVIDNATCTAPAHVLP